MLCHFECVVVLTEHLNVYHYFNMLIYNTCLSHFTLYASIKLVDFHLTQ